MKLAAMEALYNGGEDVSLTGIAAVNPFSQPDYENEKEAPLRIAVPNGLSILATRTLHGYVPGVNDILNGYTRPDGTVEPSAEEKMERGRMAISALAAYRKAKTEGNEAEAAAQVKVLQDNFKYFGYGYIKDKSELVPYIPINFWAFRVMVGFGCLFILFFAIICYMVWKKQGIYAPLHIQEKFTGWKAKGMHWLLILAIILIPCAYIASESGWLVAEFGRQPWTIQDMLPVGASVSDISSGAVATTFFIFLFLFTAMLCVEINIMLKQIKKGPEL